MTDLSIEHALIEGDALIARSTKFADEWLPSTMALCKGFGSPPSDTACPEALFAQPFRTASIAIVQVSWPRFRVLVLGRELYRHLHDPFAIADRYPPDWEARGSVPDLTWPAEPLPRRTVAMLDAVMKNGDGPFLLGASQTLVDGGKICLKLPVPDQKLFRDLWALLPSSVRRSIWPATFAFSNELRFDLLAMPALPEGGLREYFDDERARDYPDCRYERNLQLAIESNDQPALDKLLARKTTNEMIRLLLIIIAVALGGAMLIRVLSVCRVI
jgi:hypothetical protein